MVIKKPTFKTISLYIVLFCLFTPSALNVSILPDWFSYIKYIILVYLILDYFFKRNFRSSIFMIIVILLHFMYIVANVCNGESIFLPIILMLNNVGWTVVVSNIIQHKDNNEMILAATRYFTIITTITVILSFMFPNGLYKTNTAYTILDEATTFLGNDNASIPYFFISLTFSAALYIKDKNKKRILIYNCILYALFSLSRVIGTGIVCGIMMLVLFFLFLKTKLFTKNMGRKILLIGTLFFILIIVLQAQTYLGNIFAFIGKANTLGRIEIWQYSIERILQKPFIGYGYVGGLDYSEYLYYDEFVRACVETGNTHNVILQQWTWGGVIAFVLFIALLVCVLKRFDKYSTRKESRILVVLMAGFVLRSMVEIGSEYYYVLLPFFYYIKDIENNEKLFQFKEKRI